MDGGNPVPMLGRVQGDVGSGKTVVAALAAMVAVEGGRQAALMAPTELLAEQHLANLRAWLEPLGVNVAWLAGKVTGRARAAALAQVAEGQRSEEHTSELQSLMRISYAVFCLKKQTRPNEKHRCTNSKTTE